MTIFAKRHYEAIVRHHPVHARMQARCKRAGEEGSMNYKIVANDGEKDRVVRESSCTETAWLLYLAATANPDYTSVALYRRGRLACQQTEG